MAALNPARADLLRMFSLEAKIVRASGFRLFDEDGREYLDFLAQYGALPFGHNPPEIWSALNDAQAQEMPSLVQPLHAVEAERLAERLAEITPGDLGITTFANSGAETVEAAIKLARIRTGRTGILSTGNGFHGKTLGALSATGKPLYQDGFAAPAPNFDYIPYGDLDALRDRLEAGAEGIAAFIVEPIQGEGGVITPPEGYVDGAIALCREYGVLTILDEIQTGLGRTGSLFACSDGEHVPDMLLLSKALGGGMVPIGACIARPSAWDDRFGRLHSSTFANNNLACRVANATLDMLLADDQALVRRVAENGNYLKSRLESLMARYPEVIREVRGRGYMLGLEFHPFDGRDDSATMAFSSLNGGVTPLISSYLLNVQGLLTAPLFNETHVLRLQPTLIAGRTEIDRALAALEAVCDVIDRRDYYAMVRHLVARPMPEAPERQQPAEAAPSSAAPAPSAAGRIRVPDPLYGGRGHLPLRPLLPAVQRGGASELARMGEAVRSGFRPPHAAGHLEIRRHGRWLDHVRSHAADRYAGRWPDCRRGDDPRRSGPCRSARSVAGGPGRLHLDRDPRRRDGDGTGRSDHQRQHPHHRIRREGGGTDGGEGRPSARDRERCGRRGLRSHRASGRTDARSPRRAPEPRRQRRQPVQPRPALARGGRGLCDAVPPLSGADRRAGRPRGRRPSNSARGWAMASP